MATKKQYTLLIDLDRCIGCKACQAARKIENTVDLGVFWNRMNAVGPVGDYPNMDYFFMAKQCQHCSNPECVKVCPTKATYQTDDGIVLIDHDKCYGCQYCIWACPYGVRTLNPKTHMVEKCILCAHRLEQGLAPACMVSCEGNCRFFGDINDPQSDIAKYYARNAERAFRIHPELGTALVLVPSPALMVATFVVYLADIFVWQSFFFLRGRDVQFFPQYPEAPMNPDYF